VGGRLRRSLSPTEAGIAFAGQMAETLAGLGGKLAPRRGASFAAVPVVPETREPAPVGDFEAAGRVRFDAEGAG
jgi:pyruvate carboxylase